jgi:hypothetical protein
MWGTADTGRERLALKFFLQLPQTIFVQVSGLSMDGKVEICKRS